MPTLYDVIRGNAKTYGVKMAELAWKIGKSEQQTRKLLREKSIKYEDLKIIADYVNLTDEQIIAIVKGANK